MDTTKIAAAMDRRSNRSGLAAARIADRPLASIFKNPTSRTVSSSTGGSFSFMTALLQYFRQSFPVLIFHELDLGPFTENRRWPSGRFEKYHGAAPLQRLQSPNSAQFEVSLLEAVRARCL
jgi:hypothetical protein